MILIRPILLTILSISILTGCTFIGNTFKYKNTSTEFLESLLQEDYDDCLDYMALDHEGFNGISNENLKLGFKDFREYMVEKFGTNLKFSFSKSEKKFSTSGNTKLPPNSTVVFVEVANPEAFGLIRLIFDDKSKKIFSANLLDIKKPIPNMTLFWLFGLIPLCIVAFNIYVITLIKRSNLKRKWLKYVAVVLLNVPAIGYNAVNGITIDLLSFQILLGLSFNYMGYLGSVWTFGVPLGGAYWFMKLKLLKSLKTENDSEHGSISENPEKETASGEKEM
jgi:hypothetical protein